MLGRDENTVYYEYMMKNDMAEEFVPNDFEIPDMLETDRFRLRMLTADDVKLDYDAMVVTWVRQSEVVNGLDEILFSAVKKWIQDAWPFNKVAYPGRDVSWDEFQ